jgi:hypothetical protein
VWLLCCRGTDRRGRVDPHRGTPAPTPGRPTCRRRISVLRLRKRRLVSWLKAANRTQSTPTDRRVRRFRSLSLPSLAPGGLSRNVLNAAAPGNTNTITPQTQRYAPRLACRTSARTAKTPKRLALSTKATGTSEAPGKYSPINQCDRSIPGTMYRANSPTSSPCRYLGRF